MKLLDMKGRLVLMVVVHKRASGSRMAVGTMNMMANMMVALQCDHYTWVLVVELPNMLISNRPDFVENF